MASAQPSNADWQSTIKTVSERTRHMFNNSDMSDISFTHEGSHKTFYAHKYVLGTSSVVFHAMFYGEMAEKSAVLHLDDTDEKSLEEFLRFLYTDECYLTTDNVVSVMYLSKKYIIPTLTEKCVNFLQKCMDPENVLVILEQAIHFDEQELEKKCWQVIEWRTSEVTSSEYFNNIRQETIASLLKRNNLNIPESELLQAVLQWSEFQCLQQDLEPTGENRRLVIGAAIYNLRLFSMDKEEIENHVSALLTSEELNQIYQKIDGVDSQDLKWTLLARTRTFNAIHKEIRFERFPDYGIGGRTWLYNKGELDQLSFSVSEDSMFHGVRLFGNSWNSKYEVSLEVCGAKVQTVYKSTLNDQGIPGFDVKLKKPIVLQKDDVVTICARIKGPPSYYGWRGHKTVQALGVTITFKDVETSNQRTCVAEGQFHELIISI